MKKQNRFFVAALVSICIAFTAVSASAKDRWTAYTYASVATSSAVKGLNDIVNTVEEQTNGDFIIKLHLGGTLHIKAANITQAVADGVVNMASDIFFLGNIPIGGVLRLPMLITNEEEWAKAFTVVEPYLKEAFEAQGLVYLGSYRYPIQTIFATFDLHSLDGLAGRKMRVTSPEQTAFISAFGGSAVTMGGAEVPTSLQRGVVEGVMTASAGGAKKWHEFLDYNYRLGVNYVNSAVIANRNDFERLSPEKQAVLRETVAKYGPEITKNFNTDELEQKAYQQGKGMTIVEADSGDIRKAEKAMVAVWTKWADEKGPKAVEALAKVRAALGK